MKEKARVIIQQANIEYGNSRDKITCSPDKLRKFV